MDARGVGLAVTCTLGGSAALTWAVRRPAERLGARAALGALALLSARLPAAVPAPRVPAGAGPSSALIRRLAALFALDSFAGGFVLQSLVAYFLHERYGLGLEALGQIFLGAQLVTAASLLLASRAARRFGMLNTMVVSHLVSNVFLVAIAAAPTAWVAVALLYARQL